MPLFYFHLRGPDGLSEDPRGAILPDLDAALAEAGKIARAVLANQLKEDRCFSGQQIEVCSVGGHVLATVPFWAVIGRI